MLQRKPKGAHGTVPTYDFKKEEVGIPTLRRDGNTRHFHPVRNEGLVVKWHYAAFALRRQESDSPRVHNSDFVITLMTKKVFIIHGWDGYPEEGWFPWLKKELENRGFEVSVPQLPKPDEPRIDAWVGKLKEIISKPNGQTYFVGHSMGNQAIARYLNELTDEIVIGGAVFVAGFFKELTNLEDDDVVKDVVDEWLKTPIDLTKTKAHLKSSIAIFSDDDPYVPLDNKDDFANILNSEVLIEHNQGHFSGSTGTMELPIALDAVLQIAGEKQ